MSKHLAAFLRLFLPILALIALAGLLAGNGVHGPAYFAFLFGVLILLGLATWRVITASDKERASEERLQLLSDNLPKSYLYQYSRDSNDQYRFLYLSSGVQAIHGLSAREVIADAGKLLAMVDPACLPVLRQKEEQSLDGMSDVRMDIRMRRHDASWGWLELRSRPRQTAAGQLIWDGVATDITEAYEQQDALEQMARRAEALLALPRLEEQYGEREFMQHALERMKELTGSDLGFMHFVDEDDAMVRLVACTRPGTGGSVTDCPIDDAGAWADAVRLHQPVIINDYLAVAGKQELPAAPLGRLLGIPVLDAGDVCMMTSVGNKQSDYTATDVETLQLVSNEVWRIVTTRRTEKALRIASQVVNASPVVCFRWRAEAGWPVVFVSDNITQWGYAPDDMLAGRPPFSQLIHPADLARVTDEVLGYTANGLDTYLQEYRLLTGDGRTLWVEDRTIIQRDGEGKPLFYDGVLTDMTERKQRQEIMDQALGAQRQLNKRLEEAHNQLLQSEKMASIGQLAAGVAHELNNPIGFVHSNMGTLEGYLRDLMDIIDTYERHSAALNDNDLQDEIRQLKEERDFAYVRTDIFSLLDESKDGLARVRKIVQDLKSFSRVGEQEWQPADLHQGIDSTLNIVWNELKYKCRVNKEYGDLPPVYCLISQINQVFMNLLVNAGQAIETKGEITIRTARHGQDAVQVEVCDTGKGIDAEHLNRIFEPFFTTKPVGTGTGLGLSLSYSIIERHHGRIEVDSEPGKGTCFRVILPIEQPNPAAATATDQAATETAT